MPSSWLLQPRPTAPPKPPQLLLYPNPDSRCSERAAKPGPVQISWACQPGPSISETIRRHCRNPYYQPVQPLSYRLRSPRIGKLPQSSPSSKGETPWTQTVTDLYPSCPAYLRSSKAKSTNRSLTILNPTVPSPLCNLVSELVHLSHAQGTKRYHTRQR